MVVKNEQRRKCQSDKPKWVSFVLRDWWHNEFDVELEEDTKHKRNIAVTL